jgi:uncharacterized metal-binding protein
MELTKTPKSKEEIVKEYNHLDSGERKMLEASYCTVVDTQAAADRVEELRVFCRKMGYHKIGIAFCKGLRKYGEKLDSVLSDEFDVSSVCCNVCGITKQEIGVAHLKDATETACNPIGQAAALNDKNADLVVKCGFCLGHDILFSKHIKAPCTTIVVKDRKMKHRTVEALE